MDVIHQTLNGILGFVVILIPLIIVHELGHLLAGKALGVWAPEFGIGLPPRLLKLFRWKETQFTLNALPLGGFVRFEGEGDMPPTPEEEALLNRRSEEEVREAEAHSLYAQPPLKRILIYAAGPVMNIFIAFLAATLIFSISYPLLQVRVIQVEAGMPAAQAGLQADDIILKVADTPIETTEQVIELIQAHAQRPVTLEVKRGEEILQLQTTPVLDPQTQTARIGIQIGSEPVPGRYKRYPLLKAMQMGSALIAVMGTELVMLPVRLISGAMTLQEARPTGVIGISRMSGYALSQSASTGSPYLVFSLMAMVSLSLGIFNLLPIPALDGGRVLTTLVELVSHKPLTGQAQERIHQVAFFVLLALLIAITVYDIVNPIPLPQ